MIPFFTKLNQQHKSLAFEKFLISILKQQALEKHKDIMFDVNFDDLYGKPSKSDYLYFFDAYAPNGFDSDIPTIFDFRLQLSDKFEKSLPRFLSKIQRLHPVLPVKLVIITCSNTETIALPSLQSDKITVEIWGRHIVKEWVQSFPIDYQHSIAYFIDKSIVDNHKNDFGITSENINDKNNNNIAILKNEIENNECFSLVLGAGVSIDLGAKSWNGLLKNFETELLKKGVIHDVDKVKNNVGSSALITAQLCKDLYNNDHDFYWAIHQGLYPSICPKFSYEMNEIVEIIRKCHNRKHFRILTYNFDDYLERHLDAQGIKYTTLFNEKGNINKMVPIYHVHGFLPKVKAKSHIPQAYLKSIFLTEENYNDLYNKPYSWQISSQLSFFRENLCLFVGCSLSDPNIRRLLEITRDTQRKHFAIFVKDQMDTHDLLVASNHFARLNIEIIWAKDFADISTILHALH